ncbi:MAG: hypothetical protein IRZ26_09010 [Clostridia bacterium]|nr:hypothetical protein [Clostridia bacterium]
MATWSYASSVCPLCQVQRRAERVHLRWFEIENCREPSTWFRLREAAYCPRHAAVIRDRAGAELSALFEFLTREELARLRQGDPRHARNGWREPWQRWRGRRARREKGSPPCPACEAGEVAVAAEIHAFLDRLREEEGRRGYREGAGLCRRHLAQVAEEADEALARWLEADLEERLAGALEEYRRYFHLLDYRFRHEPRGREQSAWLRSLLYFWGLPEEPGSGEGEEEGTGPLAPGEAGRG